MRLIADKWTPCELLEGLTPLAAAGIPVWIDARARIAHEKALVIDWRVTVMGSYNWSAWRGLEQPGSEHRRVSRSG